jgi:hypothetical protein
MLSTIADFQRISSNINRALTDTANKPDVTRDTNYYLAHIGQVTSVDDFVNNFRLFSYAMKAHGLSDMTYAKAFMRKVLTEGTFREFASAFNFAALGKKATQTKAAQTVTAQKYVQGVMEEDAGSQNEGVRLALYFVRNASSIKNPFQILADKALTQVVQTALGLSPNVSSANIDSQAALLSKLINISDFQDPTKINRFAQRFAAMWDANNSSTDPSNSNPLSIGAQILVGNSTQNSIDLDTLTRLQTLRFGK